YQSASLSDAFILYSACKALFQTKQPPRFVELDLTQVLGTVTQLQLPGQGEGPLNVCPQLAIEGVVPPAAVRRVFSFTKSTALANRLVNLRGDGTETEFSGYGAWLTAFAFA